MEMLILLIIMLKCFSIAVIDEIIISFLIVINKARAALYKNYNLTGGFL